MTGVTVREATPDDADVAGRLLHDFNVEFETPTPSANEFAGRFRDLLTRPEQVLLLAEDAGEPVGFAYLTLRSTPYYDGPLAQLEELYVRPERRDQRIGSALLGRALEIVVACGAGEVHIGVDEVDTDTRRFYEQRFGFTNVEPASDSRMLFYVREL